MKWKMTLMAVVHIFSSFSFAQSDHQIMPTLSRTSFRHLLKLNSSQWKSIQKTGPVLSQQNDLVIGQTDPDEVVTITDTYFLDGNLTIVNNGVLNIDQAEFQIDGDIFIMGEGQLHVNGGSFTVIQEYIYEHDAIVIENGNITFSNVSFRSSGQSWSIGLTGSARYILEDSEISDGFITTGLLENSTAQITDTKVPGEFLCFDNNDIHFHHSDFLLQWLVLPDSSIVEASLPDDSLLVHWQFSESDPDINGIPYSLEMDSCTRVMWGLISVTGSEALFRDTEFRTIGLMFTGPDSIIINNVTNESQHFDGIIDVPDRTLRLVNSEVHTWSFYASSYSNITINNCIFGELLAQDSSRVRISNSVCDGTGGYLGAFHHSFLVVIGSLIKSQVISRHDGILVGAGSAFTGSEIDADESSVMFIANTATTIEPEAHESAIIFEAQCPPVEANVDDHVPIIGTARLIKGPLSPIQFDGYNLEYTSDFENPQWQPIDGFHPDPVVDDTLTLWDTHDLIAGNYALQLSLYHSLGDPISMLSTARLNESTDVENIVENIPGTSSLDQNYPNPFNPNTTIRFSIPRAERVRLDVYDSLGKKVLVLVDNDLSAGVHTIHFVTENLASGTYIYRMKAGKSTLVRRMHLLK